ncbi:uncharacterized protein F4812DRAFT_97731 [Daldinia caldariorum]|uniref:uncharacterized protein n=1 Tax=Daldinia caldariorum TaxID=326644 RepID=UPI002008E9AA|nr:uncharacterized protein F4812DRAFT_97731 [Daldinia caldariorum]KAI1466119.1 hypothetical protein F4812DRAFT_97731 [Daldinia caldariorum]
MISQNHERQATAVLQSDTSRQVYSSSLDSLPNAVIDISLAAKPGHYRLIDCSYFIQHQQLVIYEFDGSISDVPYAAISYIWHGNEFDPATAESDKGAFTVRGAKDGDQVGIDVIHHACSVAIQEGAQYLWLDRLCIIQTSRADKDWQIVQMYGIYLHCKACLVLPGGIRQLVAVEDETMWITRAWTLQEVMAPKRILVLFKWERGSGSWQGSKGGAKAIISEVIPKESATTGLREILEASRYAETLDWTPAGSSAPTADDISVYITGDSMGVDTMLTESLSRIIGVDARLPEGALPAWQNAFWRASSRPVDMVLSIMGVFGVSLNPSSFHKDDRIGATIALAQEILRGGGKPAWLVMAFDLPPSPFLSSFPEFPETDVTGRVEIKTATDEQCFDLTLWYVADLPDGSMDDDGYLSISAKAAQVVYTGENVQKLNFSSRQNDDTNDICADYIRVVARDGGIWNIYRPNHASSAQDGRSFVAFVGHAQNYERAENSATNKGPYTLPTLSPLRAVILEEHGPGKFHRAANLTLGEVFEPIIHSEWQPHDFAIGGPLPLPLRK